MPDQEPFHTFPPAAAANAVDITPTSIRRWSEYHRLYLSAGANPPAGENRRYTWQDVETLRKIKEMRDNGLGTEAINLALAEVIRNVDTEVSTEVSTELAVEAHQTAPDSQGLAPNAIVALSAMQTQIEALQRSSDEAKRIQQHSILIFVVGVGVGVLLVVGLLAMAALWWR